MDSNDKINFIQGFLVFLVLLSMALIFFYFLTHEPAPLGAPPVTQESEGDHTPHRTYGGVGMTYSGKLGLEIAPNLIMPFDGGGLNMGFGF